MWQTGNEDKGEKFELTGSNDGKSFSTIAVIEGKGSNSEYTYTDALATTVYYRFIKSG